MQGEFHGLLPYLVTPVDATSRVRGLRKGTLGFWRWMFAREAAAAPRPTPPTFLPIQLAPPRPAPVPPVPGAAPGAAGKLKIALGPCPARLPWP